MRKRKLHLPSLPESEFLLKLWGGTRGPDPSTSHRITTLNLYQLAKESLEHPSVPYPKRLSEFELQSWLYSELKSMGIDVRGEVTGKANGKVHRYDLVLFFRYQPVVIVEVKAPKHKGNRLWDQARIDSTRWQKFKYEQTGVYTMVVDCSKNLGLIVSRYNRITGDNLKIPKPVEIHP